MPSFPAGSRFIVIGTSGSGKTTLASAIAARLGVPHAEQDAWNHLPGWQEAPLEQFRAAVDAFTSGPAWVVDGNYTKAQDIGWTRADTLIWLDYPAPLVFWRLLRRTLHRSLTGQHLWNGNRESLRLVFSRNSILIWFFRTHWRNQRQMPEKLVKYPHLKVLKFRRPGEASVWVQSLEQPS